MSFTALEVVDVEEQDPEARRAPERERQAVGKVLPEEGTVGQARQLVVKGSTTELSRTDREFSRSVSDPTLDLAERSPELLAEEVHPGRDGADDISVGTDERTSPEVE